MKDNFPQSELDVQFSLFCCQGDGLNIYGKVYLLDSLKYLPYSDKKREKIARYLNQLESPYFVLSENRRYAYSYKHLDHLNIESTVDDMSCEISEKCSSVVNKNLISEFLNDMLDYFEKLDSKFEKYGYKFFYEISDEDAEEMCDANGYEFFENGSMVSSICSNDLQ